MASAYSTPNPTPAKTDATPHAVADDDSTPHAGPAIDIALVGGVMLVISVVIVLAIFFLVYWDVLVSATQYPLRPSR